MLIVSWFADGPKWENMALATFYPQGLSYFRPFRYRHEWISEQVLDELRESGTKVLTSSNIDTLLCAKFSSGQSTFPIRRIKVTHIQASADEYYLYFKVGPLVDYRQCTSILDYSAELMDSITEEDRQKLIHSSTYDLTGLSFVPEQDQQAEDSSWAKLLDLLCLDKILPLENVKHSVFLRLSSLIERNTGKAVIPSQVGTSERKGKFYGYALKEAKYYEAELLHRVPLLIGTQSRLEVFNYRALLSGDYLQASPDYLEISGNYESHVIQLYGKESSPEGQILRFAGPEDRKTSSDEGILNLHDFQVYFKNKFSFRKWLRKWFVPLFVIFAILFVALILRDFGEKGWAVFCSPAATIGEIILLIIVAAISGAVFWRRP